MREWTPRKIDTVIIHRLLEVQKHHLQSGAEERDALVFSSVDWVNVIPLDADDTVILVRQWRYGTQQFSLEIPGGLVDPGESHETAAGRELVEETGFRAGRLERLGGVHPNPALFDNRMSFWLATELEQLHEDPLGDGAEELEVVRVPLADIPELAQSGEISHALALCGFYFLSISPGRE